MAVTSTDAGSLVLGAASDLRAAPATAPATQPLRPGDTLRTLRVGGMERSYLVHVPPGYVAAKPTPVVLAFHGAFTNARIMELFSGLSRKADAAGFIVVYPNGTGARDTMLFFNAFTTGGAGGQVDDVAYTAAVLDDVAKVVNVDPKRVFATGVSNGGMMCYLLAARLSDRIAAIAPVAGTMANPQAQPRRPVPIIHFHGTADKFVPFKGYGPNEAGKGFIKSVPESIKIWAKLDGCPAAPAVSDLPDTAHDGTKVHRKVYGPGKDGAEVILYVIDEGGHTWPGQPGHMKMLGIATANINANDLMWDFFCKHPMK